MKQLIARLRLRIFHGLCKHLEGPGDCLDCSQAKIRRDMRKRDRRFARDCARAQRVQRLRKMAKGF